MKSPEWAMFEPGKKGSHPSVRVLGGLVVVPDTESGEGLGLVESHSQSVGLTIGERDQPHVLVISGDIVTVYEPR